MPRPSTWRSSVRSPWQRGTRITAAHIDNPRLDLKPNPLYEDSELAFFKTHYYGGIKKYQWTTVPMAIHGVVAEEGRHCSGNLHR